MSDYSRSKLFTFYNPIIKQRYEMHLSRQRINKLFLISYSIVLIALSPIIVQRRALIGDLGKPWIIYTILSIIALILYCLRVLMELFYDTIEKMKKSRRLFYYNMKSSINVIFIITHSIVIGMGTVLKAENVCDSTGSPFDSIYCNTIQFHGMPIDSFVVIVFFLLLYQITFPVKYIYTVSVQIIQFIAVINAAWKSFNINSNSLMIVICLMLYVAVAVAQYSLQRKIQNNFILKDSIDALEFKKIPVHDAS